MKNMTQELFSEECPEACVSTHYSIKPQDTLVTEK